MQHDERPPVMGVLILYGLILGLFALAYWWLHYG
jgi:hypothetical protein